MEIKTFEEIFLELPEDASYRDRAYARRSHKQFLQSDEVQAELLHRKTVLNNIKKHINNNNYSEAFSNATNNFKTLTDIGRDELREFFNTTNFADPVKEGASAVGNFLLGVSKGIVPGANKFASEFNETFIPGFNEIVSPWLEENVPGLKAVNQAADNLFTPKGTAQEAGFGFGEVTGQVVLPGAPLTKGAAAVGVGSNFMSRVLGYGTAEVIGMPPEEMALIEMGIDYMAKDGEVKNAIMESLAANEDLPTFLQKIQRLPIRMAEGGIVGETIGKGVESIGTLYRYIKGSPQVDQLKSGIAKAGENAQARLDANENTTTLSSMGGGEIDKAIDTGLAHMQNKKTGQYIGGPQGLNSPKKLAALRLKARKLAEEGESGKFWYERSGKAILDAVGGNIDEADKIIQAIAVTSPSTPVKANFDYAIQAYSAYKAGNPIKTGRFPTAMSARLEKIFAGEEWVGRKIDDFYNNLMVHIDPSRSGPVTGDLWMMRAFGFTGDMPSQKQYEFVTKETQRLAGELGWEPHQVQAAMWVAQKAKSEGKPISAASYDYSTALKESLAQISWESIPGKTSSHMLEMFDAPLEVKSAYHVDISKAFLDENGTDVIAKELGLVSPGDFEAPGYFEGLVSPGTQTEVAAPRQYKGPKYGEVDSSTVELINAYATARGILMKQDGVGWHRPFFNPAKKDANGIDLRVGRKFSEKETAQLADILKELSGHSEYNPIATENGVRLLNFDYLDFDNKKFAKLVKDAITKLDLEDNADVKVGYFSSQNGYVANDWSVNKNGEDYIRGMAATGRPDIHGKVFDIIKKLQARIDDVDAEYSEKYGFTRNQEINSQFRSEDTSGVNLDAPVERGADG